MVQPSGNGAQLYCHGLVATLQFLPTLSNAATAGGSCPDGQVFGAFLVGHDAGGVTDWVRCCRAPDSRAEMPAGTICSPCS